MIKTNKLLLASLSALSVAAFGINSSAFALDHDPNKCIYSPIGDLIGVASDSQVQAACNDVANVNHNAMAALSAGGTTGGSITTICDPKPQDPQPWPEPLPTPKPSCPQLTCDQKLGVCSGNLAKGNAAIADLEAALADRDNRIAELQKALENCANKPLPRAKKTAAKKKANKKNNTRAAK